MSDLDGTGAAGAAPVASCWVPPGDELLAAYHDTEWGRPVLDERGMYERLCLEAFQAGLSWRVVLAKRPALREAFAGFDPAAVARFDANDVDRLLTDERIIRNRRKIEAAITNARLVASLDVSLVRLVWQTVGPERPAPRRVADVPATSEQAAQLARELRRRGFAFVGPTTAYATLQAAGVVNDHLADCPIRMEVEQARQAALRQFDLG